MKNGQKHHKFIGDFFCINLTKKTTKNKKQTNKQTKKKCKKNQRENVLCGRGYDVTYAEFKTLYIYNFLKSNQNLI